MQIEGGNWRIFDQMIKASGANVHLNTAVTSITKKDGKYGLKTSSKEDDKSAVTKESTFDSVILAAPLQFSGIELAKGLLKHIPDEIPYVKLHVTLFTSPLKLKPSHFNKKEGDAMPNNILTTLASEDVPGSNRTYVGKAGFFSISTLKTVTNPKTKEKEFIYKIFSPETLTSSDLKDIFGMDNCKLEYSRGWNH